MITPAQGRVGNSGPCSIFRNTIRVGEHVDARHHPTMAPYHRQRDPAGVSADRAQRVAKREGRRAPQR